MDPEVGKTCLHHRLLHDRGSHASNPAVTFPCHSGHDSNLEVEERVIGVRLTESHPTSGKKYRCDSHERLAKVEEMMQRKETHHPIESTGGVSRQLGHVTAENLERAIRSRFPQSTQQIGRKVARRDPKIPFQKLGRLALQQGVATPIPQPTSRISWPGRRSAAALTCSKWRRT